MQNFKSTPDNLKQIFKAFGRKPSLGAPETMSIDEVSVLECPDSGCTRNFRSVEDMELHITVGRRGESVYVKLRRDWVD